MAKLTPRREAFCREFMLDNCATQAAVRAAYAKATAKQQGSRLLTNADIQDRIAELRAERSERTNIAADDVVRELARIGFGDLRDLVTWGPDGVRLKPSGELAPAAAALVESVSEGPHGIRIKTKPAVRALELLGRHVGMFVDRSVVATVGGAEDLSRLSDAEIDERFEAAAASVGYVKAPAALDEPRRPLPGARRVEAPAPDPDPDPDPPAPEVADDGEADAPASTAPLSTDLLLEIGTLRRQLAELRGEAPAGVVGEIRGAPPPGTTWRR